MLAIYHSPNAYAHEALVVVEVSAITAVAFFKAIKDKPEPGLDNKIVFVENNKVVKETFLDCLK